MTRLLALTPESTSMVCPRSRPTTMLRNSTTSLDPTTPTWGAFGAKEQGVGGQDEGGIGIGVVKADLGVAAGDEFICSIVNIQLDQQGAGVDVNRARGAHYFGGKFAPGHFGDDDVRGRAHGKAGSGRLRDSHKNAEGVSVRQPEKFLAGTDQIANINVAGGERSGKGRGDVAEGL